MLHNTPSDLDQQVKIKLSDWFDALSMFDNKLSTNLPDGNKLQWEKLDLMECSFAGER